MTIDIILVYIGKGDQRIFQVDNVIILEKQVKVDFLATFDISKLRQFKDTKGELGKAIF